MKIGRHFGTNDCSFFLVFIIYTIVIFYMGHNFKYFHYKTENVKREEVSSGKIEFQQKRKTTFIIGIVTSPESIGTRTAIRKTWKSLNLNSVPFNVIYKFIFDSEANGGQGEKGRYDDIVFLTQNKILAPSERLFLWLSYTKNVYPSASLVGKMEANVSLCMPDIFYRIEQLQTGQLLYGYQKNSAKNSIKYQIHNAFMVFGGKLVTHLAKRRYCSGTSCSPGALVGKQDETQSLGNWLEQYPDVDFKPDNERFLLKTEANLGKENYGNKGEKDICVKYLLYQPMTTKDLQTVKNKMFSENMESGSVSAKVFSGEIKRKNPKIRNDEDVVIGEDPYSKLNCKRWAVSTTIYEISRPVINMFKRPNMCTVIVADTKTPSRERYLGGVGGSYDQNRIVFLTPEEQDKLYPYLSKMTSWKTFGRKNIGYIFAMHHGARIIWDFDDDNDGIVCTDKIKMDGSFAFGEPCIDYKYPKINPYPYFGVKEPFPWPRGFPLQDILNKTYSPELCRGDPNKKLNVGVVQSLANIQPDVDAVYRFTRHTPFNFISTVNTTLPMRIPQNAYTPFNAQATLWNHLAFKYMVLPVSVNGRVADIWRSYFAEFFFFRKGIDVIFTPPFIDQQRNPHEYLGDFNAENDLYQKSFQLIRHLSNQTLTEGYRDLDDMYNDMYRREYLNLKDVGYIKAWLKTYNALNIK